MHVDISEGHLASEMGGHHDHPCHPEEDDVKACDQHARGQELREVLLQARTTEAQTPLAALVCIPLLAGLDKGRKGNEGGGEPGVEHIGVLHQPSCPAGGLGLGLGVGLVGGDKDHTVFDGLALGIGLVPGRNLVSPPELARDAPVLNILEPVAIGVGPVLGEEADLALVNDF